MFNPKLDIHDISLTGAPDVLFRSCSNAIKSDNTTVSFDASTRSTLSKIQDDWSSQGQRVLALCRKSLEKVALPFHDPSQMEEVIYHEINNLTLLGLVGIIDPPRPEIKNAIATMRRAGIRVFMVTGDFKLTAAVCIKYAFSHCEIPSTLFTQTPTRLSLMTSALSLTKKSMILMTFVLAL